MVKSREALTVVIKLKKMLVKDFYILLIRIFLGYIYFSSALCKLSQGHFGQLIGPCNLEEELAPYKLALFAIVIAVAQLVIGILLLSQRYALLGAIMTVPMNISILGVTLSQQWRGTPYINVFFLLLNALLLLYDYQKLKFLIFPNNEYIIKKNTLDLSFPDVKWLYLGMTAGVVAGITSRYNHVAMMVSATLTFIFFFIGLLSCRKFYFVEKLLLIAILSAIMVITYASVTGMLYLFLPLLLAIVILLCGWTARKFFRKQ